MGLHHRTSRLPSALADEFAACCAQLADSIAIEVLDGEQDAVRTISYAELERRASAVSALLVERGVRPGDRVVALLPRSVESIVTLVAVAKAGATYVPLDPRADGALRDYIVHDSLARVAVVGKDVDGSWPSEWITPLIATADFGAAPAHSGDDAADRAHRAPGVHRGPETVACLLYPVLTPGGTQPTRVTQRAILRAARSGGDNDAARRVLHFASPSTEVALFELWQILLGGSTCVLWPDSSRVPVAVGAIREGGTLTTCAIFATDAVEQVADPRQPSAAACLKPLNPVAPGRGVRAIARRAPCDGDALPSTSPGDGASGLNDRRQRQLEQELLELAERVLQDPLPTHDPSVPLLDLGFDSLMLAEAAMLVADEFGVELTLRDLLEKTTTLERLAAHLLEVGSVQRPPTAASAKAGPEQGGQALPSPFILPAAVGDCEAQALAQLADTVTPLLRSSTVTPSPSSDEPPAMGRIEASYRALLASLRGAAEPRTPPGRHRDRPPAPGARLGRDPDGNPGWFVVDEARPGKYRQIIEGG